ncbi:FMN-binding protein [Herbiconiux liukaitaii]|uniref:FMN-binding protein n=1 Tax=Herbiconiux liukaitaii TaxID=3342799 RepID=UPI0035B9B6BD
MNIRQKKIALASMTGLSISVALAGCATDTSGAATDTETSAPTSAATSAPSTGAATDSGTTTDSGSAADSGSVYTDGTYEATGSYTSPNGQEEIDVSLTLEGDIITAVTVTPEATNPNSVNYQNQFADGIAAVVEGKNIDEIDVSRVAGSSLTSGGFNEAVETIKGEAS